MTTSIQEGPVILIGYEYRLQLQAEADLFPEGASFVRQLRSAITATTVVAELSSAAGSVLRPDGRRLELVLAPGRDGQPRARWRRLRLGPHRSDATPAPRLPFGNPRGPAGDAPRCLGGL